MGKSTIMVIFNSYAKLREGTTTKISSKAQQRPWLASGFDLQKPPAKWFANSKNMDGIETIQKNDQDIQDWVNSPTGSKPYKYRDDCCRSFNKKSLKKSSRLGITYWLHGLRDSRLTNKLHELIWVQGWLINDKRQPRPQKPSNNFI